MFQSETSTDSYVAKIFGMDLNNLFVPNSVDVYYPFAEYFFSYTILGSAISKYASFPLTGLSITSNNPKVEAKTKEEFRKKKIKEKIVQIGVDYQIFGLAFMMPMFKISKTLECPSCNKSYLLKDLNKSGLRDYGWSNGNYSYSCTNPKCKKYKRVSIMTVKERAPKILDNLGLTVWSPYRLEPITNEITGDKQWLYSSSKKMDTLIRNGEHEILVNTPELYIKASLAGKKVRVNSDKLFVLEAPGVSINGKPVPPMVKVFNDLYLRLKYIKTNVFSAEENMIPLKMLFPVHKSESGNHPMTRTINMTTWKDTVSDELDKWKKDKTYVPILPIEIGDKDMWGRGKLLVTHAELKANLGDILAGMGYPIEFLFGGATWSRQNVSSIILENSFKIYQSSIQDMLSYFAKVINKSLHANESVTIKLTTPRLVETKSDNVFIERGFLRGEVSPEAYYDRYDIDYKEQRESIEYGREVDNALKLKNVISAAQRQVAEKKELLEYNKYEAKESRKIELENALAMAAVEKDNMKLREEALRRELDIQTKSSIRQAKAQALIQNKVDKSNMALQLKGKKKDQFIELKGQEKQQKIQLKGMAEQSKIQIDAIEPQMIAEYKGQKAVMQLQEEDQMQQYFDQLSDEEKIEVSNLPPEEQMAYIQQATQMKTLNVMRDQLSEEESEELNGMDEESQMEYLSQKAQEQEEAQAMNEMPEVQKEKGKAELKQQVENQKDEGEILSLANTYNKLRGGELERFKSELMIEDVTKYSKVKAAADTIEVTRYVHEIMNTNMDEIEGILTKLKTDHPDLEDEVTQHVDRQMFMQEQASAYALNLIDVEESQDEEAYASMIEELKTNTPKEFREMVMRSYSSFLEMSKEERAQLKKEPTTGISSETDKIVADIIGTLRSYKEEDQHKILSELKNGNPTLYKKVAIKLKEGAI